MCTRWQHRDRAILVAGLLAVFTSFPSVGHTATLSRQAFATIVGRCAPSVDPAVMRAVAATESHFDPLALRNNTRLISVSPASLDIAIQRANQWIANGDSVDLGLMQVNSRNLAKLGLTVEDALDPCHSLEAGAHVLTDVYRLGASSLDRQAALLIALSRYNTGRTLAGLANGYVGQVLTVQHNMERAIPQTPNDPKSPQASWDVWGVAATAQHDVAVWLIGSQATSEFLIGAGAQPKTGELRASSERPEIAPGM